MKKIVPLIILTILIGALSISCNKEKDNGTLQIKISPKINGNDLQATTVTYINATQGVRYRVDHFEFYISNIQLTKNDNSVIELSGADNALLFYWKDAIRSSNSISIPAGDYKKITFTLGLDSILNATAPGNYPTSHVLGADAGNYWVMNSSYIFSKLEGFMDTTNTSGAVLNRSFVYHIGANGYTKVITLNKSFSISENASSDLNLLFDMPTVWNGSASIDMKNEIETHTINNPALATKVLQNMSTCFSAP